jgi:hypothetical protein
MSDSSRFGDDKPIDVANEIAKTDARLPIHIDRNMPLDITIRTIALGIAQRHIGDTVVREGGLYQQLKMDNKLGHTVSIDDVIRGALIFERYLWGEWSKGIAESALAQTDTEMSEAIEKMWDEKLKNAADDDPNQPSSGNSP